MKYFILFILVFNFSSSAERLKIKGNKLECLNNTLSRLLSGDRQFNSPGLEGSAYAPDIVETRSKIFREYYEPGSVVGRKTASKPKKNHHTKNLNAEIKVNSAYSGKTESLVRYMSYDEALEVIELSKLSFKSGHKGGEKWVGVPKSINPHKQLGKKRSHSHKVTIIVEKGTINWLRRYEVKPDVEPNRFGIPYRSLENFNNRIVSLKIEPTN